jgi:NAD(P)-dependent dehydrogenase (short-subunit alcohol dehydrogenase family)
MSGKTSLEGRVAIVTGAGRGIGRSHALALADRGASVVVNDLGGSTDGAGASTEAADSVVAEIRAAGGKGVANYDSVSDVASADVIVRTALDAFGRLDILINNAGIFGRGAFAETPFANFERMISVHLMGAAAVTRAAWPLLIEQGYGRVVMTASSAGLWGLDDNAGYCAAKAGVIGLAKGLAHEGLDHNVRVNVIAPGAKTRSTATMFKDKKGWTWRPDLISPLLIYLASEDCRHSGAVFAALAGTFARVETVQAPGARFDPRASISDTDFLAALDRIANMVGALPMEHGLSQEIRSSAGLPRSVKER